MIIVYKYVTVFSISVIKLFYVYFTDYHLQEISLFSGKAMAIVALDGEGKAEISVKLKSVK